MNYGNEILRADGLGKKYGAVAAVDHADISVHSHEIVAIMGDNGAGKSTFVKMLAGAVRPDHGTIEFLGEHVRFSNTLEARLTGIEAVHQTLALVDTLDIASNIFVGRELSWGRGHLGPLKRRQMQRQAAKLISTTGVRIPDVRAKISVLSGGQRQGVAIARAIAWDAKLIILDEPTAALGVDETAHVEEIIRSLRERDIGCLLISHNLPQVFRVADTVYVMRHGRTVGSGLVRTLTENQIIAMITGYAEYGLSGPRS